MQVKCNIRRTHLNLKIHRTLNETMVVCLGGVVAKVRAISVAPEGAGRREKNYTSSAYVVMRANIKILR